MNQEIEELRAEKEALKLQLQRSKRQAENRNEHGYWWPRKKTSSLCGMCNQCAGQKKKVLKKQKKLRQMRDTKIHPEIHEPVQEPLGGSDLGGIVIESASTPQTSTQHEPENSHSAAFEQPLKEVNSLTDRSWKCLHKRRRGWKGGRQYISCERRERRERIPEIEVFVTLLLRSANIQVGKVDFDFDLFYSNARFYDIHCYEKINHLAFL